MVPDFAEDSTIRLGFVSTAPDGTPTAPSAAFTAADFAVYKDGSATQKTTTNGITVTSPFDSLTGRHLISIDTSNDTGDAGFWASGSVYEVVLSTAKTVDSKSVSGYSIGEFRLGGVRIDSASVTAVQNGLSTFNAGSDEVTVGTNNDKAGYALSESSRDAIIADFLAHVITKGSAGTIERAFWQAAKAQASASGEVSGTPTVSAFDTDLTAVTGAFDHLLIVFTSGSLAGEARPIDTYSSTNGRITLQEDLTAAPSSADEFLIIPSHVHLISDIQNGLATSAALATVDSNVDTLVARISSTLFSGITSLASWLGALAGKTADSSTLAEIQSTTAGAGFDNTADSLEAIRDRGDAAWAPGEAGSGDASQSTLLAVQDQVEAIAGQLGGTAISVTSRIADGGAMVIYTGDDLKVRSGTQVTVSISDPAGGIYSRLSALGTSQLSWGAARQSQAAGAISGTISSLTQSGSGDDQVVNLVIEILDAGQSLNPADDYIWQVASTSSSGDEYTEIEGTLDLRRRVAVPVTA